MTANELVERLRVSKDFELEFSFYDADYGYRYFKITGITGIEYSGKEVILEGEEL